MNIADSIKKARKAGVSDDKILQEIEKQNPQKKNDFDKARQKGASSTRILDEMIAQNEKRKEPEKEEKITSANPPPKEKEEEIPKEVPPKPSEETKLWVRVFITLGLVTIASLAITLLYRTFFIPRLEPISPQLVEKEVYIPRTTPPLVALYPERDDVQRIAITTEEEYLMKLRRILREERGGELIRLIVEDHREESEAARIATLRDFFGVFDIEPPEKFFEKIDENFTLLVYTGEGASALGFVASFDKEEREDVEWTVMRPWEESMEEDFLGFFGFWGDDISVTDEDLRSEDYYGERSRSDSIRYREGEERMGIYYSLMDDSLIFATSEEAIKELIERYHTFKEF